MIRGDLSEVEAKTGANLLVPGESLSKAISAARRAGCPTWRVWSQFVPRVPYSAGDAAGKVVPRFPIGIPVEDMLGLVRPNVAVALLNQCPVVSDSSHDLAQLRYLSMAVFYDIHGGTVPGLDRLNAMLVAQGELPCTPRHLDRPQNTIDRDARLGRKLWARLGAFPWSLYGPTGKPTDSWWREPMAIEAWRQWSTTAHEPP